MRKNIFLSILVLAVLGLFVGNVLAGNEAAVKKAETWCQDNQNPDGTFKWQSWPNWPGTDGFYKGTHPHGMFLKTHINEIAANALAGKPKEMPVGTVIVKENYMKAEPGGLAAITMMNNEGGDWFWAKISPKCEVWTKEVEKDGKKMSVKLAGAPKGCIGCHATSTSGIKDIMTNNPKN